MKRDRDPRIGVVANGLFATSGVDAKATVLDRGVTLDRAELLAAAGSAVERQSDGEVTVHELAVLLQGARVEKRRVLGRAVGQNVKAIPAEKAEATREDDDQEKVTSAHGSSPPNASAGSVQRTEAAVGPAAHVLRSKSGTS